MSSLCVECNLLSCTCTENLYDRDENSDIDESNIISEQYMDKSFNIIHRALLCDERSSINEHLEQTDNSASKLDSSVLNLKKKSYQHWVLNVQGICGKEMSKISEMNLMLTSPENKKPHVFGICEIKLKKHKISSTFKINGFQTPFSQG